MRTRGSRIGAIAIAFGMLAVACHGTSTAKSPSSTASGSTSATLNYNLTSEIMVGWDPADSYSNEIVAMNNM